MRIFGGVFGCLGIACSRLVLADVGPQPCRTAGSFLLSRMVCVHTVWLKFSVMGKSCLASEGRYAAVLIARFICPILVARTCASFSGLSALIGALASAANAKAHIAVEVVM